MNRVDFNRKAPGRGVPQPARPAWRTTCAWTLLCAALGGCMACQAEVIVGGTGRHPASTNHGVQIIVGRPAAGDVAEARPSARVRAARPGAATPPSSDSARSASGSAAPSRATEDVGARERESDRLWILEQELGKESKELENKRRLLSLPTPSAADPLATAMRSRLQDEVVSHERNLAALRRELGRVKTTTP
ncbi:MAG: hypothetical protein AAGD03_09255 [Bordetella sp.]|nr:hypothetical protein [Pseudomonadota bacterium]